MITLAICLTVLLAVVDSDEDENRVQNDSICMGELGCFAITENFKNRRINVLPQDKSQINTRFSLYTRQNPDEAEILKALNVSSIANCSISPNSSTKFIVHGFIDNDKFGTWMNEMKNQLLLHSDYNVIVVSWGDGSACPYEQAAANTRVVGAEIAFLIQTLDRVLGIKPETCHVIGHSLGSHIAGYAGERLSKLGRISGLDPAEPFFQDMPPCVRLDQTDAEFVDAIHSDAVTTYVGGLGMTQLIAHVDFFPNDGKHQPGCVKERITSFFTKGIDEGIREMFCCDHMRAIDFFISSINFFSGLQVAYECQSWKDFLNGKCAECANGTSCAIMGIRADEYKPHAANGKYVKLYMQTSGDPPFWLYSYQVTIQLAAHDNASDQHGKLSIQLFGDRGDDATNVVSMKTRAEYFQFGDTYTYLLTWQTDIGNINQVSLRWKSKRRIYSRKTALYIKYIKVIPMHILELSPRNLNGKMFCKDPDYPIKSGEVYNLPLDRKCTDS